MLSVFVASCSYVAPHAAVASRRTAHANMLSYNNALGGADIAVHDVLYEEDHLLLLEQIASADTEQKPGCASCCRKCGAACPGAARSRTPKMSFGEYDAFLREIGRAEYISASDDQALEALSVLCRLEGILPALETSHTFAMARELARESSRSGEASHDDSSNTDESTSTEKKKSKKGKKKTLKLLICLSGRGDKDVAEVARLSGIEL